ncbi:MAG: cation:proton antiporter [Pseudomonadota bacterium]
MIDDPAHTVTFGQEFLFWCLDAGLIIISIAFFVGTIRVIIGPTIVDRILALDLLVGIAIGFIALIGLRTGFTLYVDIAIALGLVGFLATVAFARFILHRGETEDASSPVAGNEPEAQR